MRRTVLAFLLVGAGLALGAGAPAPARAADRTAQTGYSCQIQQGNGSQPIATEPMTLGITLGLPATVTPGQSLALRGTLRLAFPEELSKMADGVFTTADGYSDTMSIQVDGKPFRADRWQTPEVPIGDPIVVSAPISFPALRVPNDPGGSLDLAMARNNVVKNPYFSSPSPVAFTATASARGPAGTFTFNLACYLTSGRPATLARIPIRAPGGVREGAGAGAGAADDAAQAPPVAQEQPGSAAPGSALPPATPGAQSPARTAAPSTAADGGLPTAVAGSSVAGRSPGPQTVPTSAAGHDGVYVPAGALLGVGALVVVLALAYAAWAHYRLRMMQQMLDD